MRKRINALRRKYQRTRNNEDQREQHRSRHLTGKASYTAKIKKVKITSWKEYCNMTSSINPWNEVYKLAACKKKKNTQITTLRKTDGILTADIRENLSTCWSVLLENKETDDTTINFRTQAQDPADTADGKYFD